GNAIILRGPYTTARRTSTSGFGQMVRSLVGKSSGRYYVEFEVDALSGDGVKMGFGVATATASLSNVSADRDLSTDSTKSFGIYTNGYWSNGSSSGLGSFATDDVIGLEIDVTNRTMRANKNGGAFSSAQSFSMVTGTIYLAISISPCNTAAIQARIH